MLEIFHYLNFPSVKSDVEWTQVKTGSSLFFFSTKEVAGLFSQSLAPTKRDSRQGFLGRRLFPSWQEPLAARINLPFLFPPGWHFAADFPTRSLHRTALSWPPPPLFFRSRYPKRIIPPDGSTFFPPQRTGSFLLFDSPSPSPYNRSAGWRITLPLSPLLRCCCDLVCFETAPLTPLQSW